MLLENPSKINWYYLSGNSNDRAVDLLLENPYKIDWGRLSTNPNIFNDDYKINIIKNILFRIWKNELFLKNILISIYVYQVKEN